MPLDTAIQNIGDYYSAHYLDSVFSRDIKPQLDAWRQQGTQSAPSRLKALGQVYFRAKTDALEVAGSRLRSRADGLAGSWHAHLLDALGYERQSPRDIAVEGGKQFAPVAAVITRFERPWLFICEAPFCLPESSLQSREADDPLEAFPLAERLSDPAHPLCSHSWEETAGLLLTLEDAPRWLMLLGGGVVLLLDKNTFAQGRYLRFDLDDAYGRGEKLTFDLIAAFLSRETLCPGSGEARPLHETIEEQSHKFAHGVTESLQYAVREAIELLANEWIADRQRRKLGYRQLGANEDQPYGTPEIAPEHLRHEALVFVYRLLFCFYAEARGEELGILPFREKAFEYGYSLEALRELEQVPLTPATETGSFFHEHLRQLFRLIRDGFNPEVNAGKSMQDLFSSESLEHFNLRPLTATIFSTGSMPLFERARFSNRCLQAVIRRLSLSRDDNTRSIGRVNYAELGVNQLGAVYEGLLSYQGMFAMENLIKVKPAGKDVQDSKTPVWFVPESKKSDYSDDEIELQEVSRGNWRPRIYPQGSFVLYLGGLERSQTASYYTPEPLTRCLTEEALNELLVECGPDRADSILELKLCEPAMGSGAFLIEATRQLATRYLELKQKAIGHAIDPGKFQNELRRVQHYITTRNVYGVDLNPLAVEFGELSLWLSCIHTVNDGQDERPCATPWFGLKLRAGNSLIGARRAVWTSEQLRTGRHAKKTATGELPVAPRLLKPGEKRNQDEIYQFLVFDPGMVPSATDGLVKSYHPEDCAKSAEWKKNCVSAKWAPNEIAGAKRLCEMIDARWIDYSGLRSDALERTACTASVWPNPVRNPMESPALEMQERVRRELEASSGSFQRLKLIMDAWCALWFWPVRMSGILPGREAWLAAADFLLRDEPIEAGSAEMISMRLGVDVESLLQLIGSHVPKADDVQRALPWMDHAAQISRRSNFHHWELIFPEVLGPEPSHQGFDLVLGNPPWINPDWEDSLILAEIEPKMGVKELASASYERQRFSILEETNARSKYINAFETIDGSSTFLNSIHNYPELTGMRANLYKNFLVHSWGILADTGILGFLHPEGVFDDAGGSIIRNKIYLRLRAHYQFENELGLFAGTNDHGRLRFSINIYGSRKQKPNFSHMSNIFHPLTISQSKIHEKANDPLPGIKTIDGEWNINAHCDRLVTITENELELFCGLLEEPGVHSYSSRLPQIHAGILLSVLKKLSDAPLRLLDLDNQYFPTQMFNETHGQTDGVITRHNDPSYQPKSADEWVLSGPHFFVGTPFNKTPRLSCLHNNDYDPIDLTDIPEDYLPRAVYRPGNTDGVMSAFLNAIDEFPKPSLPGFWPVNLTDDWEQRMWDILLGEPVRLYGIDPKQPGARTARKFICLKEAEGDVPKIMAYLRSNPQIRSIERLRSGFGHCRFVQMPKDEVDQTRLPKPITSYYRFAIRQMINIVQERSLISCIQPPGISHIHGVMSLLFVNLLALLSFSACSFSLLFDYMMKCSGRNNCHASFLTKMPFISFKKPDAILRVLRLTCLTKDYADLWEQMTEELCQRYGRDAVFHQSPNTSRQQLLNNEFEHAWSDLDPNYWDWKTPLRTDYARRWALLEIDVLVAQALGLTLEEMITIYQVQFPVMRQYEAADEYDQTGRRLPNTARKDPGGKEVREARQEHDGVSPLTVSWTIDGGRQTVTKTFYPPWVKVDREAEYGEVWTADFAD